jgi:hypothetical protein
MRVTNCIDETADNENQTGDPAPNRRHEKAEHPKARQEQDELLERILLDSEAPIELWVARHGRRMDVELPACKCTAHD